MRRNTSQLWDKIWETEKSLEEDIYAFLKEKKSTRWKRIEKRVLQEFKSFEGLEVIEIGAGVGIYAALMAEKGARVTVLDYSEGALKRARDFFKRSGLTAKFIKQDVLSLPAGFFDKYDISMSFGLAEHFKNSQRVKVIKVHFDCLRKGGVTFISVPNKYNPPYWLFKTLFQNTKIWKVGEEYPYSRKELKNICEKIGIKRCSFFGDSFISSFNFINPLNGIKKIIKLKDNLDISKIQEEKENFLDHYLGYALILYGKK
jgi:2-polyprenyl-3-methyl-5-hydroxy-6-metoxy-1,4-benzoquinol methylase